MGSGKSGERSSSRIPRRIAVAGLDETPALRKEVVADLLVEGARGHGESA
jgi:hypothetical protein